MCLGDITGSVTIEQDYEASPAKPTVTVNGDVSHTEENMSTDLTMTAGDEDSTPSSPDSARSEPGAAVTASYEQPKSLSEEVTLGGDVENKPTTFQSELSVIPTTVSANNSVSITAEQPVNESHHGDNNVTNGEGAAINPSIVITTDDSSLSGPQQPQVGDEALQRSESPPSSPVTRQPADDEQRNNVELTVGASSEDAATAAPVSLTIGAAASEPSIQIASSVGGVEQSDNSTHSLPTSAKSPTTATKKKNFWQKLARIFKPWKWRRKKRSKKLEQQAVGESS